LVSDLLAPTKVSLPGENPTEECSSSFDNIKTSTGFVCKRQVSKLFRGLNNRFEYTFVYRIVSAYLQRSSPAKFATSMVYKYHCDRGSESNRRSMSVCWEKKINFFFSWTKKFFYKIFLNQKIFSTKKFFYKIFFQKIKL
jgi:hypothetical protein